MSISRFGWIHDGKKVDIFVSLCTEGRYLESDGERLAITFEYPPIDDEIYIGLTDLEDMGELGQEIRDALEQQLNLGAT